MNYTGHVGKFTFACVRTDQGPRRRTLLAHLPTQDNLYSPVQRSPTLHLVFNTHLEF